MSFFRMLAVAVLAATLAGCHSGAGAVNLVLQLTPSAPVTSSPTQFVLEVQDGSGRAVTATSASLDLVMTTMDMGVTPVAMTPFAPGSWTGTGQFAMAGDWDCRVTATVNGKTQAQTFHFKVS